VVQNTAYSVIADTTGEGESKGDVEGGSPNGAPAGPLTADGEAAGSEGGDDDEEDVLGLRNGLIWLGIITVATALASDAVCATIQDATEKIGVSKVFTAAVILPIVGNACEHAGAVLFAVKGKLDLTLGIAIGSSTQIALCVLPFMVILGWMMDHDLSMNFGAFESGTLFLTVVAVTFAIKDGTSNWLLGLTLMVTYAVVALGFWAHHNDDLDEKL
jgi:Ca2+:H+ antiporter